ncbi:class I SAM-dependent methyltransferase, partial [Klebsiella pneumoniae]
GLDTRPYRLDLPPSLPWIEADLAEMIDAKESALADERPRCDLTRVGVDLCEAAARGRFLDQSLAGRGNALVLCEGLLMYLEEEVVRSLACDLA